LLHGNNDNNGGGPAIDIHIHAIVTGPGVGPGSMDMTMILGPLLPQLGIANTVTASANSGPRGLFCNRQFGGAASDVQPPAQVTDEDDMGIFADL
jgi:hypothetical protein